MRCKASLNRQSKELNKFREVAVASELEQTLDSTSVVIHKALATQATYLEEILIHPLTR